MNADESVQDEPSFESLMARLEELVHNLEHDELGLDQAIRCYEEGSLLAQNCLERLDAAELRVQELSLEPVTTFREG